MKTNKSKAISLYLAAAKRGHVGAQFNLGVSYSRGDGVGVDVVSARYWLGKATEQGHEEAKKALATIEEGG